MAVDMFLKITGPDVAGESMDKAHPLAIDVLSWSWGVSNSGSAQIGGGAGSGKANFQDLSLTKWVDKSSPLLLQATSVGQHYKVAKLIVRKAGTTPLEYITITLTDLIVTSLSTGGSGGEDRLTENVTLNFAKFQFDYVPQKHDGTGDVAVTASYDIAGSSAK